MNKVHGWRYLKIKDFTQVIGGGTPKTSKEEYYKNGDISWITPADLTDYDDIYISKGKRNITRLGLEKSSAKLLPEGTVLFSSRAPIGHVAIASCELATNQGFKSILPSNEHDSKYLYYYLKANKHIIESKSPGTTFKEVSGTMVKELEIPLPPIEEQKRIADILDKVQQLINDRKKAIEKLSLLQKVQFEKLFGNPSNNINNYPVGTIGDLTETTNYGTSKKAHETDGYYPCLRMNNITYDGDWNLDELKYVDLEEEELNKYLVYKGDLLFNRTNSKELVGKTAVFKEDEPMAFAGYLIRLRTNERALTEYIAGYLNSSHGKAVLQNMCKNIVGMANINAKELQSIKILVPPIEVQQQYVQFITKLRDEKKRMKDSLRDLETLYQSLLQRAFKGELTKQKVG